MRAGHFGRRVVPDGNDLLAEAADYVEVLRRLWDSWEDDAEIRDVATGRFVDRNKLHYIDFDGPWFSVKGPSITPRPPQGQPIVAALGHGEAAHRLIADSADVGFITPHSASDTAGIVDAISSYRAAGAAPVRVFADLVVFLDDTATAATARRTGSTPSPRANSPAMRQFSSARPNTWPTCCRSGTRQARPDSACGPPRFHTTCGRSPTAWFPNCAGVERSATPTRPLPFGTRSISRVPPTATRPPAS